MCRLLAYAGEDTLLSKLLLEPDHSLEKQAWQPRELREAKLNADGFGFAWYKQTDSQASQPTCYRQTLPIWNDANLAGLAHSISNPLWLAYIRSATQGLGITLQNTQPFTYRQWVFVHNGYIESFNGAIQHRIREQLEDPYLYLIKGYTDSEYIFALLMQLLQKHSPEQAIRQCFDTLASIIDSKRALLNVILSDGTSFYASKHAINGLCPTLYYGENIQQISSRNQILASEPLNKNPLWQALDDHCLISMRDGQAPGILPL